MNKSINNSKASELDPIILNNLLEKYSEESSINKWDMGASSSRDLSVQVHQGNAKQLKGSQRNSMTLRVWNKNNQVGITSCLLYTSPSPRDGLLSRMPSSA